MKACFISFEYPPDIIGGLGTYADQLVRGLKAKGVDVCVVTRGNNNINEKNIYRILTPNRPYWRRFFFTKQALNLVGRLNKSWKFNIVHLNGPYPITTPFNLPTVCTFHSSHFANFKIAIKFGLKNLGTLQDIFDFTLRDPIGSLIDITTARLVDKIICPNQQLVLMLQSYCFADPSKFHVIPNGFIAKIYRSEKARVRNHYLLRKYGIKNNEFFLYVGRLSPFKGIEYLIKAFKLVRRNCKKLRLVIAGNGSYEPYLRKLAGNNGDVIFIGFVDSDIVKGLLYNSSIAVIIPSLMETLPMVALEAMACSKPVIASDVGGIPSVIKHGKNGFLVKPRDVHSLKDFMEVLYDDPKHTREMGSFGRKLVEKEFTIDKMTSQTLKVYESLQQ